MLSFATSCLVNLFIAIKLLKIVVRIVSLEIWGEYETAVANCGI